jgi:hypothetical protein
MSVYAGPEITTNGLVLSLDAANLKSYPGTGTTWFDLSGGVKNCTLVNGPTYDTLNGGNIVFDGTNDHITGTTLPSGTDLFTMSYWLYFNANINGNFGPSNKAAILFSGNSSGTYEFLVLPSGSTAGAPYTIALGRYAIATTGACSVNNVNMPIQRYHNLVLVRDGAASQKIYLNGEQIGTGNVSDSFTSAATMYIGGATAVPSYSGYFNGKFGAINQYNRALSASEIQQNFNALRGRFGI